MYSIWLVFLFVYGTIFGSFYNVIGLRVPTQSLLKQKRSYCDNCQQQLTWRELIPIWAYIFQKGRCRTCKQKISILYPLMEGLTGLLFTYSYLRFGWSSLFLLSLLLVSLIIPITVSDLIYQKIPNQILLFFMPVFLIYRIRYPLLSLGNSLLSALFSFVIIYSIIILSGGGMGIGDLKYYTLFGFVYGVIGFLMIFFLSVFYGCFAGLFIMKFRKTGRKTKFAFAPYIGLAALTVLYFGTDIFYWYMYLAK